MTSKAAAEETEPGPAPDRAGPEQTGAEQTGPEQTDAGAAADGQEPVSVRMRQLAEAAGPTTLATALLIYFGYIATRARFAYFGISIDMTGMSNQTLLLLGLEVVYVPATIMCLSALLAIGAHTLLTRQIARHPGDTVNAFLAAVIGLVGTLLIARALIGIFLEGTETSVTINVTPLALAFGPVTVAYAIHLQGRNRGRPLISKRLARNGVVSVLGLALAGLLWFSTTVAWAYGTGRGEDDVRELPHRPEVILDLKEPLQGTPSGIAYTPLPSTAKDPAFAHRYRGFRLLLAAGGRLFLVGSAWTLGRDQTIVVPYDGSTRVQLVPQP
ncbi:hypothetical protein SAMN05444920_107351 [Nonomuraea solani]|uniref:Uncharacterized protein n=2 Tax=Nonomuraea solani TaxID=1144553 RepID=A0A1H6E2D8_9ACTN|nr:hypothetical protein SAMN05444920_107351 [Nonomuraea solani]